jgi:hypothetical protein
MKFPRNGLKLSLPILLLLLAGVFPNTQARAQGRPEPPPPTMPGMDSGPPTLGEWYKPPQLVVMPKPQMWVREFVPNSKEKRLLAVAPEDLQQNARFLSQPGTGAFRLLPFYPPAGRVISANRQDIDWRPGFSAFASSYSFTKKKHGHGVNGKGDASFGWSDLRLKDGVFTAGIMAESVGLMVQLGDVPLEELTMQTAGVVELITLVQPRDNREAFALFAKHLSRYHRDGFIYSSKMSAVLNRTYVLRSMLNHRSDQLIAFRVVRLDGEGLTIVWKKLQEYTKPSWTSDRRK